MRILGLVLAAALLLAAPQAAGAQMIPLPRPRPGKLEIVEAAKRYTPAARSFWSGSPCEGREIVHVVRRVVSIYPGARAQAFLDGSCRIQIEARIYYQGGGYNFCVVLAHEFGHLAGHDHTDDESVMNLAATGYVDHLACREAEAAIEPPPTARTQRPSSRSRPSAAKRKRTG